MRVSQGALELLSSSVSMPPSSAMLQILILGLSSYPFPGEVSFPFAQNQSCDPYMPKTKPCDLGHYVSYSINVTGAADIAAGIDFARRNNVRLVIKNTGHEYVFSSA